MVHGERSDGGCRSDTRYGLQLADDALVEGVDVRALRVARLGGTHLDGQGLGHLESEIDVVELVEAADHQPRAGHERHGQRDLGDDQSLSGPGPAGSSRVAAVLQRSGEVVTSSLERRHEAEHQWRDERDEHGKHEHVRVHVRRSDAEQGLGK